MVSPFVIKDSTYLALVNPEYFTDLTLRYIPAYTFHDSDLLISQAYGFVSFIPGLFGPSGPPAVIL